MTMSKLTEAGYENLANAIETQCSVMVNEVFIDNHQGF